MMIRFALGCNQLAQRSRVNRFRIWVVSFCVPQNGNPPRESVRTGLRGTGSEYPDPRFQRSGRRFPKNRHLCRPDRDRRPVLTPEASFKAEVHPVVPASDRS